MKNTGTLAAYTTFFWRTVYDIQHTHPAWRNSETYYSGTMQI